MKTNHMITGTVYNNQILSIFVEYTDLKDIQITKIFDIHTKKNVTLPKEEHEALMKALEEKIAPLQMEAAEYLHDQLCPR